MHILEAKALAKTIKKTNIVHDISLLVKSKEIVGLLGPNGAGKTTSFYMVCGLTDATAGEVFLDGENIMIGDEYAHVKIDQLSRGLISTVITL